MFDIPEIKEQDIKKINIFLAGNSSKSKFVEELFNERIEFEKSRLEKEKKNHLMEFIKFIDLLEKIAMTLKNQMVKLELPLV